MKVLNLIIKQTYFDQIIAGEKTQEFREVKPTTIKKLLQLDDEGFEVEDEHGNALPIEYDAIRFFVGYNKDRDSALVEVKDAYCEIFTTTTWFLADSKGNVILYEVDQNGEYVRDEKGNLIEDDENGQPYEVEEGTEGSVSAEVPIEYEYRGQIWVAEQVVFNLGKIIELHRKGE